MPNNKITIYINGLSLTIGTVAYFIIVVRQSFFRVYGYYGNMYESVSGYYSGIGFFYLFYSIIIIFLLNFQIIKLSPVRWGALYIILPILIPMTVWYFHTCLKPSIYQKSCIDCHYMTFR